MAVPVTYMGTKRQLADHVRRIATECRTGPFLDAFSGMCAVGSALSAERPIWSNDKQKFAVLVAKAHFMSASGPPDVHLMLPSVRKLIKRNSRRAKNILTTELNIEAKAIESNNVDLLTHLYELGSARKGLLDSPNLQCGIFADRYAGTYFGYAQSIEIDALRISINELKKRDEINSDDHRWLVIALAKAISKVSTTTGHFAQPLRPKANNVLKFASQRRRSVTQEWVLACGQLEACGTADWRKNNKVFEQDAEDLIAGFRRSDARPSVIYADPPYTKDQYSRFYHVYETLVLYDAPPVSGEGLYRADRFTSQYSLASSVASSIETLVAVCAEIEADLIFSYPTNGLLSDSIVELPEIFYKHYGKYPSSLELPHVHSTLGGSKGKARSTVTERIYWVGSRC